jgi:hypothetical protein
MADDGFSAMKIPFVTGDGSLLPGRAVCWTTLAALE